MTKKPASPDHSIKPASNSPARTNNPVLLLLHQHSSCAGAVGAWLDREGYEVDIKRPMLGDDLPDNLNQHAGVIVFGGPMSANDDTPEINREIDWLTDIVKQDIPCFGICLGAQMIIRALGGEITMHKKELVEVGYHPIKPTLQGKQLVAHWPKLFFQWHKEGFSLPTGTVRLASGSRFENQAFSYGDHVFGVQFHPEATPTIIKRWSSSACDVKTGKGAHIKERLLADHQKYGRAQQQWLHQFMVHWTSLIKPR